jgi:outer membrane protein
MRRLITCLAVFLFVVTSVNVCRAGEFPLWEAGFGATGITIPDYRGSNQQRFYALPMPYLIYRGDVVKLDRKGLYSLLFHSDRVRLNFSADGGVPVESKHNTARSGMPDLDPTFQIGPSLEICPFGDCRSNGAVQLQVPVRAVFAIAEDFSHAKGIGFVVNPRISFDFKNVGPGGGWFFGFSVGPLFATDKYHNYYYTVDQQYVIPGVRPAYDARGGYSGSALLMGLTKRFKHIWFGTFARYDYLGGAAFKDSPLMRTDHSFSAGFGLAWVFAQSKTMVQATE